jgi:hypothetical protein
MPIAHRNLQIFAVTCQFGDSPVPDAQRSYLEYAFRHALDKHAATLVSEISAKWEERAQQKCNAACIKNRNRNKTW